MGQGQQEETISGISQGAALSGPVQSTSLGPVNAAHTKLGRVVNVISVQRFIPLSSAGIRRRELTCHTAAAALPNSPLQLVLPLTAKGRPAAGNVRYTLPAACLAAMGGRLLDCRPAAGVGPAAAGRKYEGSYFLLAAGNGRLLRAAPLDGLAQQSETVIPVTA
jgi:hypothetical protein